MTPLEEVPTLKPADPVARVIERLSGTQFQTAPVLDAEGRLLGVVSLEEVLQAADSPELRQLVLAVDLMRGRVTPLRPDDSLEEAMAQFVEADL